MESIGPHRRARINYSIRTVAFAYCFIVLAIHGWERAMGPVFWTLLVLQFLAYPHLMYLRSRFARDSKRTEEDHKSCGSGEPACGYKRPRRRCISQGGRSRAQPAADAEAQEEHFDGKTSE